MATEQELLEKLAKTEHQRWNAAKLLDGYVLNKAVKGKDKNKTLTHPDLVPFDDMGAGSRCYDYVLVYNLHNLLPIKEPVSPPPSGTSS